MDRDIPTFNHLIVNKIQQKNLQLHQKRLMNIKPTTKNTRSYLSSSLNYRQNKKAQMLEQQKKTQIEKHNNMLFNKMMNIMKRTDPVNRPSNKLDNNSSKMVADNIKLQEENRSLFERIDRQKPTINNKKLYEERKKNLNILKFLGKYSPHSLQSTNNQSLKVSTSSSRAANSTNQMTRKTVGSRHEHYLQSANPYEPHNFAKKDRYQNIQFDEQMGESQFANLKNQFNNERVKIKSVYEKMYVKPETDYDFPQNQSIKRQPLTVASRKISSSQNIVPRQAKDIILYKAFRRYENYDYEVKIIRKHNSYEIQLFNSQRNECKIIQYDEVQGTQLLQQNQYNYPSIINKLKLDRNGDIQIINQKSHENGNDNDNDNEDYGQNNESPHFQPDEQQDLFDPNSYKIALKNNYNKNHILRYNPSHISQLNQEQSYNQLIQQQNDRPCPIFINNNIREHTEEEHSSQHENENEDNDSLGQSDKEFTRHCDNVKKSEPETLQMDRNCKEVEHYQTVQRVEQSGNHVEKPLQLQQKEQKQDYERKQEVLVQNNVENAQQYVNIYQQALDQQIL